MKRKNVGAAAQKIKKLQNLVTKVCKTPEYWTELAESAPDWIASDEEEVEEKWHRITHRLSKMSEKAKEKICDGICRYIGSEVPSWIDWAEEPIGNVIGLMLEVMDKMGLLAVLAME